MSVVDEDVELSDLLKQTLEANGCLPQLRAQLRSSIFLALDEDIKLSQTQPLLNNKLKTCLESAEGRLMFCIVREFLEFFNLDYTISIFEPESYMNNGYKYEGRSKLAKEIGLSDSNQVPLLMQLLKKTTNLNGISENQSKPTKTEPICSQIKPKPENHILKPDFNATFDLSNPTVAKEKDDTYEDTSSIAEDSPEPISKVKTPEKSPAKKSLSSLADLPPLQLNKNRGNDILPSLYSKEFKDKSNLRELDKLFDIEQEYEEDFIGSGEISLKNGVDTNTE